MKRNLVLVCVAALSMPVLYAQEQSEAARRIATELMAQAGGLARAAVETRVTRGKPYSAEAVTEFVQVLGDGNRIVRKTSARLFRDAEGRTRREELTEHGGVPDRNSVVITDPVAGNNFILHAGTRIATKTPGMFARFEAGTIAVQRSNNVVVEQRGGEPKIEVFTIPSDTTTAESRAVPLVLPAGQGEATVAVAGGTAGQVTTFTVAGARGGARGAGPSQVSKEDLGQQQIEGVTANGTRTTTTIPAGAIGNELPITVVSEQWFTPDLDVLVLTRHNDPRVGETTYRLTNISRNEPDRSLFQVPSDYTLQDRPMVWERQQRQQR